MKCKAELVEKFITNEGYHAFVVLTYTDELSSWLTGYVEITESNKCFEIDELSKHMRISPRLCSFLPILLSDIDITWSNYKDRLSIFPDNEKNWLIGFDCWDMETQNKGYCIQKCEELSRNLFKFEKGEKNES